MRIRHLTLAVRVFLLLLVTVLVLQLINVALLLTFPPALEPTYTLRDLRAALAGDADAGRLRTRTVSPTEVRAQEVQFEALRDQLAKELELPPDKLILEFAKGPSPYETRGDKGVFEASNLAPMQAPRHGRVDPTTFTFSGHFKVARQLEDGNWLVVAPADSLRARWQRRALIWLGVTVLLVTPLAYFVASWLSTPIRKFSTAAERLGRNLQEPALVLAGPPEIVSAARTFNEMSQRLRQYVNDRMTMVAAIAHDLRTPLTRLAFRIEGLPSQTRTKAEQDIQEMQAMLTAVLEFIHTIQTDRPRQRQELRSLLTTIADEQADLGHKVIVEDGPDIVLAGDRLGLRSLFTNLIGNAIAYGGGACVRLFREDAQAIVEIDDEGPGLAEDQLEKVFSPFYRVESSRNRETGGIGLGLALVRSVAVAHGGYAWLENRADRGVRARVALPL